MALLVSPIALTHALLSLLACLHAASASASASTFAPPPSQSDKGLIRGTILSTGYVMYPDPEAPTTRCKMTYVVQADPKGMLPPWLVNWLSAEQVCVCVCVCANMRTCERASERARERAYVCAREF